MAGGGADWVVKGLIQLQLEGKGPQEAVARLKEITESAKKGAASFNTAGDSVDRLGSRIESAGRKIAAFFAVGAIARWAQNAYVEFAKTERAFSSIEAQINALGQTSKLSSAGVRQFISQLTDQTGIIDDDLAPAFNRLLLTFNDVNASQRALQIAARFAASGFGTVQSNAEGLATILQTGSVRALRDFGIKLKSVEGDTIDVSEAMRLIQDRFEKLPPKIEDAQTKVDTFRKALDDMGDAAGSAMDKLFNGLAKSTSKLADLSLRVGLFFQGITKDEFDKAKKEADDFFTYVNSIGPQKPDQGKSALDKAAADRARELNAAKLKQQEQDEFEALKTRSEYEALFAQKGVQIAADAAKKREEIRKQESQAEREILDQAFQASVEDALKRQEDDEKAAIERAQNELDAFKSFLDSKIALEDASIEQQYADRLAKLQLELNEELAKVGENEAAKDLIRKKYANLDVALAQAKEREKRQQIRDGITNLTFALSTFFAKNKKVAIATAIIDTLVGANAAFRDTPGPFWVRLAAALAALATGYARVRAIRAVNVEGGGGEGGGGAIGPTSGGAAAGVKGRSFDDPANDRAAYLLGRKSAADLARFHDIGFRQEAARMAGSSTSTTNIRQGDQVINVAYAFGDKGAMRKLARELRRAGPGADGSNLR